MIFRRCYEAVSKTKNKQSFQRMTTEFFELRLNEYLIEEWKYKDYWIQLKGNLGNDYLRFQTQKKLMQFASYHLRTPY